MIIVNNLTKKYQGIKVLDNISLKIEKGEITYLVGENGAGKSTLIKCLIESLYYQGVIIRTNEEKLIVAQEKVQFPHYMSVKAFLSILCDKKEEIASMLSKYNLKIDDKTRFYKLSKGMYQKIIIIGVLLVEADVYIFDEPLSGLDEASKIAFMNDIKTLLEQHKTVIIATHLLDSYPQEYNHQVIRITKGKIV